MNKKLLWLISVPIVLVPYLTLFTLSTFFFSSSIPLFNWIMESVFDGNALYLIAALALYCILITLLSVGSFLINISKNRDTLLLAKFAMILKLAQIPAYLCIFVLGVIFVITIFTIPFSIGLFIIDCLSVFSTGLFVISSVIVAIRRKMFTFKEGFWIILLQFVFCADVIAAIILYIKLKRLNDENKC